MFHQWTLLSNHAHVLVCLARDPDVRSKEVAARVGITERSVFKLISDLEKSGVIVRSKEGRCNHYDFHFDIQLRHPLEENKTVGDLIKGLLSLQECKKLGL